MRDAGIRTGPIRISTEKRFLLRIAQRDGPQVNRRNTSVDDFTENTVIIGAVLRKLEFQRQATFHKIAAVFEKEEQVNNRNTKGKNRSDVINCRNLEKFVLFEFLIIIVRKVLMKW